MTIASLLKARLLTVAGGSVGTRVYPRKLPQHPTYPALVYQRISNTGQNGTSNRKESRWQIGCWAETDVGATALAATVKTGLEEYHAVSQTPAIEWARVVNELDDYDDEVKACRNIVDVILTTTGD
jgi:hypothetical protein